MGEPVGMDSGELKLICQRLNHHHIPVFAPFIVPAFQTSQTRRQIILPDIPINPAGIRLHVNQGDDTGCQGIVPLHQFAATPLVHQPVIPEGSEHLKLVAVIRLSLRFANRGGDEAHPGFLAEASTDLFICAKLKYGTFVYLINSRSNQKEK